MKNLLRSFASKRGGPRGPCLSVPTHPEPIRGNPKLHAVTEVEKPHRNSAPNGKYKLGLPGGCTNLHKKIVRKTATLAAL